MSRTLLPDGNGRSVPNGTSSKGTPVKATKKNAPPRIDRRVARTRALLQDALVRLIPERGYASITVEDICALANVGRSTFYAHYAGKDELRTATMNEHLRVLNQRRRSQDKGERGRLFAFSLPMFEHAHAFRSLHRALLSSSGDTIHDELRERVRQAVRSELDGKRLGGKDVPAEFAVQFVAGAFLAVLAWWTAADSPLSPAEVDGLFQQLASRGVGM